MARFRREALVRRAAPAPEHRAGVRLGPGPEQRTATTSSWSTWTGRRRADLLREHKQLGIDETVRIVRDACHGLDYAHRAGRRAPRREAGQPADRQGDGHHEARRLRHRQGGRADADHPGRLGARHGRLPVARAGARRGGRAGVGHLLARRVRLPVPDRAAAARVHLAHRAGAQAAAGAGRRRSPTSAPRCRRSWTRRCGCASSATRTRATPRALEMAEAHRGGRARRGHRGHAAARGRATTTRRGRCDEHRRHAGAAAHARAAPSPTRVQQAATPAPAAGGRARRDERDAAQRAAGRRRSGTFLALLAVIAAIAIVALALLSSSRQQQRRSPVEHRRRSAADRRAARLHPASTPR